MGTFTNSEDPDKMLQCSITSGSTLFVKVKSSSVRKIQYFFENYNLTPLDNYLLWTIQSLLYQTRRKYPLVYKGLKDDITICD